MLTLDLARQAFPNNLKTAVTPELVNKLNGIAQDPELAEEIRNNFISYTGVLREGKFKTEDYLSAVVYASFKLRGDSNQDAYMKTFQNRWANLVARGTTPKDMSSYVHAYAKNKLVNLILEQAMVPTWVLNQDIFQKAINTQFEIMTDVDVSPKVRSDAANSLMTHLKKPEIKGDSIKLEVADTSGISELKKAVETLAKAQQESINSGAATTQAIAGSKLIEGTATVVREE